MAALGAQDRLDGAGDYMRDLRTGTIAVCLKADIRAAYNAVDDWIVTNATAFNNTLPAAAKNNMSSAQKAQLFMMVLEKRYIKGA